FSWRFYADVGTDPDYSVRWVSAERYVRAAPDQGGLRGNRLRRDDRVLRLVVGGGVDARGDAAGIALDGGRRIHLDHIRRFQRRADPSPRSAGGRHDSR